MRTLFRFCALLGVAASLSSADEITDWNTVLLQAGHNAGTAAPVFIRSAAIVQASVYDAVNGIEQRFAPIHVAPAAPSGASSRAAAVMAAYNVLIAIYPAQQPFFDSQLASSLAGISSGPAAEHSVSIARGIEWGQTVAAQILAWRSVDGFLPNPPPFLGGNAIGEWRPTPPAFAPGAVPQLAHVTPWVLSSPSQFRPAGPPDLTSARYASDFNEVKSVGESSSALRTADQTLLARFWASASVNYFWDTVALSLAAQRHLTFSEKSRLLALVNIAMSDAGIACWDAKYHYVFWRPVTAIPLADMDGNPSTDPDAGWTPLLVTPAFPEYPSGHACTSTAAATMIASVFGDQTSFSVDSDSTFLPAAGIVRSFSSFSDAVREVSDARVFAGIHFRSATDDGQTLGAAVAGYILQNAFQPVHGNREGQTGH